MFDNWWKDFDPLNYNAFKKNVIEYNKKIEKFWSDFLEDIKNSLKK